MASSLRFMTIVLVVCLSRAAIAEEPVPIAPAAPAQVRQTVQRAIGYLQTETASWLNSRGCAACHHVPWSLWALSDAERQGYSIDREFLSKTVESLLGGREQLLSSRIFPNPADPPDPRPQGRGLNMGLPFLAVAAQSITLTVEQRKTLEIIAEEIVRKQQADGSWEFFDTLRRPPVNETQTTDAAWIILALRGQSGQGDAEAVQASLAKAEAWLEAKGSTELQQEVVLKLLMDARAGKKRESVQGMLDELLALQRADGGWSQTIPEPKSDAYATGQALYVLWLFGYTAEQGAMKRGIDFLVAMQLEDGSWPMDSRSTPDGSPGSSTLLTPIQCASAAWATLALANLVPAEQPEP